MEELQAKILSFLEYMENDRTIYFECRDCIEAYKDHFNL